MSGYLLFAIVAVIVIAGIAISVYLEKKRRDEMRALATRLGLNFSPGKDYAISEFMFLDRLANGDNRYAFNVMQGNYQGHEVMAFDYHYETHSRDSKGRRTTHHHYLSFFILMLSRNFPELTITREWLLSKISQVLGYDDIDFESAEFSRKFCVRSHDKKFAYDVCNALMMEYLLANADLSIEIERQALALAFERRLSPAEFEKDLNRLVKIRSLMPNYLFT